MDINQIENNIEALLNSFTEENFIYGLLAAYGLPNAAVTRLRNGEYNLSKDKNQILWKKRVCYQIQKTGDLHSAIDVLRKSPAISKQHPRFLIVTDFTTLLAIDTENSDSLDIPLKDLTRHFDFFLPWAGMEKSQLQRENPADIKAAERMGHLYDLILEENPIESEEQRHSLNVFFTRLLFCYFAEDTGIFPSGIFVNGIASHTSDDGTDLQSYLFKVFETLNQHDRGKCPAFLAEYPYVNGGLFATSSPVPRFNAKSRKILIECGALNWKAINPDIFGSMMQAVVHTDERSGKGMHYTSVVNIMKVIEPLFLNDLREELENAGENKQRLQRVLDRIYNIRIFDPACGSGNFLIIAYKELCKLEIEIFKRMNPHGQMSFKFQNKVKINQFYGIEIDDFAHETAKLALWLAEHQMNLAFREVFGDARPTLPLQDGGNIVCGNAAKIAWEEVCPTIDGTTVYILGNPPYLGARNQSRDQKVDMMEVLGRRNIAGFNNLDYISCWIVKASDYIRAKPAQYAFVSTNSVCQGTQVASLWPYVLKDLEIGFAHQSFKWANNARGNAGVVCVIIGVRNIVAATKTIYQGTVKSTVKNINPYLVDNENVFVVSRREPISALPNINYGSFALDDGNFTLTLEQRNDLLEHHPEAEQYIRPFIGSKEFLQGSPRYCLWLCEAPSTIRNLSKIRERVDKVRSWRMASGREATNKLASEPHTFAEIRQPTTSYVVFPTISSERREYIPAAYFEPDKVASNQLYVIPAASPAFLGAVSCRMHMTWLRAVAGRLKTDLRYSSALCYNTFPFPELSEAQKADVEGSVFQILDEREKYPERTLAQLYDPNKMPSGLKRAHQHLDSAVERCYRKEIFNDDNERLSHLFRMYSGWLSNGRFL